MVSLNENITLQKFINDYNLRNKSIISDTFYGITRTTMKCNSCARVKYSFQIFNLLTFQLRKVKNYKKKKLGDFYNGIDLYDAFECEKEEESLTDDNMIFCNQCKCLREGKIQTKIYGLPRTLIIILNRGKNNQDFKEEFHFPEKLDFTNGDIVISKNSYLKYYLCGIITRLGESSSSGHFIAYCRNEPNSKFHCYNDASVSITSIEDSMREVISEVDYNQKTPYILFYHHSRS
jgi:ubiquitin carboxyl-terminal hydrolase 20/33